MAEPRLEDWVGRSETLRDVAGPAPIRAMDATLGGGPADPAAPGAMLPPLWHWLYFLPVVPMAEVGPDGHPKRGGFLPPVALERRMWAGGRLTFHAGVPVGAAIERRSEILKVEEKSGRAGRMVFVTLSHLISTADGPAIAEEQDIVYMAIPERFTPPPPVPAPETPGFADPLPVDPVLLFRFSALTFNGHRIHYDLPYATGAEHYPGLVVHGPLQAMALMGAARAHHPGRRVKRFAFRGVRPLFHFDSVRLVGAERDGGLMLATADGENRAGMQAELDWA